MKSIPTLRKQLKGHFYKLDQHHQYPNDFPQNGRYAHHQPKYFLILLNASKPYFPTKRQNLIDMPQRDKPSVPDKLSVVSNEKEAFAPPSFNPCFIIHSITVQKLHQLK